MLVVLVRLVLLVVVVLLLVLVVLVLTRELEDGSKGSSNWVPFFPHDQQLLEGAAKANDGQCSLSFKGTTYSVDLLAMTQTNDSSKWVRPIRRQGGPPLAAAAGGGGGGGVQFPFSADVGLSSQLGGISVGQGSWQPVPVSSMPYAPVSPGSPAPPQASAFAAAGASAPPPPGPAFGAAAPPMPAAMGASMLPPAAAAASPGAAAAAEVPECAICMEYHDTGAHAPRILTGCGHTMCEPFLLLGILS